MTKHVVRTSRLFRNFLLFCLAAHAFAAADPPPCAANPENRRMDYWLGDWAVSYPGMSGTSTSKVHLALDQCMIIESWDNGRGHRGENMFAYSADDKSWHGMFADNQGRVHVFVNGTVASGSAEYSGPSRGPNGETVLNRIRIVEVAPGHVRQTWDKSSDNGATWTTVFRGDYSHTKP